MDALCVLGLSRSSPQIASVRSKRTSFLYCGRNASGLEGRTLSFIYPIVVDSRNAAESSQFVDEGGKVEQTLTTVRCPHLLQVETIYVCTNTALPKIFLKEALRSTNAKGLHN